MTEYSDYHASSIAEIDLSALANNLETARKRATHAAVIAVVKANAYGHGAVEVALHLQERGVEAFGVATLSEAEQLREAGITQTIVCLFGFFPGDEQTIVRLRLQPVVYEQRMIEALAQESCKAGCITPVHLDVDTGMGRVGVLPDEATAMAQLIHRAEGLVLVGIMTHYTEADLADSDFTGRQAKILGEVVDNLKTAGITCKTCHQANSAATLSGKIAPGNTIRPGLLLYGVYPGEATAKLGGLKPVLSWKSRILHLKQAPTGTPISYGRTFITTRPSLIATIPVGYADGYNRALSNRGEMLVRGKRAPIVGRVCMDLTMLDVTDIPGVTPGDEVVLIGTSGDRQITADELAAITNTINYEILTSIGSRVRRVYSNE
jgi:alanine racemase